VAIQYVTNALGPTNSTTSVSVTLPTTAAGDLLIFEYVHRGTGTGTIGGTSVTTGGLTWNNKHDQLFGASAFSGHTYWTIATGNHSGQTVTASSLTNSSAGIVTVYSGAHQTAPLDDATVVGEQNASGDEGQAAITTATNGAWVVLVVVNSPDLAVSSQAAANLTITERAERLSTGGTDASIAHASGELATAGSSGAFTWAQTNAASGSWAYAIKPDTLQELAGDATGSATGDADVSVIGPGGGDAAPFPHIGLLLAAGGTAQALAGDAVTSAQASAALAVAKALAGAADASGAASADLALTKVLAGDASAAALAAAGISVGKPLAGAAEVSGVASGALDVGVTLSGAALAGATADGALTLVVPLAGAADATGSASAELTTTGSADLAGDAAGTGSASAELLKVVTLAGAAIVSATADGAIAVAKPLAGDAAASGTASGGLTVDTGQAQGGDPAPFPHLGLLLAYTGEQALQGAAQAAGTADAALDVVAAPESSYRTISRRNRPGRGPYSYGRYYRRAVANSERAGTLKAMAGAADASAAASGSLSLTLPLAGAAIAAGSANGELTIGVVLTGDALASALASANLSTSGYADLEGAATGTGTASAALSLTVLLTGAAVGTATASGQLNAAAVSLEGAAAASGAASAELTLAIPLSGAAIASALASGSLETVITLSGAALAGATASAELLKAVSLQGDAVGTGSASAALGFREPTLLRTVKFASGRPRTLFASDGRRTAARWRESRIAAVN
jgi:hypothetical protein